MSEINTTKHSFDQIRKVDNDGLEYWEARELMSLLEYTDWRNFENVIRKARISLQKVYPQNSDHFVEVNKMIKIASGTKKETFRAEDDYRLSRYACYLIAQNADPKKKSVALAQSYFAVQTRKQEIKEERDKVIERIIARRKLSETEKKFSGVIKQRNVDKKGIAEIKSAGDWALFGSSTKEIKKKHGIKDSKPLADYLPTITIKAKDLATEITTFKTQEKDLDGVNDIKFEHINNNKAVRKLLNENGIYPERLPIEEDINKLTKKFSETEIIKIENSKFLGTDKLEIDITNVFDENEIKNISKLIKNNQGNSKLIIYYGSKAYPKILEREIQINADVIAKLRKYIVINNDALN